jgi:hypothetical protein
MFKVVYIMCTSIAFMMMEMARRYGFNQLKRTILEDPTGLKEVVGHWADQGFGGNLYLLTAGKT